MARFLNVLRTSLPLLLASPCAGCHHASHESQPSPAVARADLTGVWAYDPEQSDQLGGGPRGMPGGGMGGFGGRGGRGGRGGGGFGGGGGGGGGGGFGGGRGGEGGGPYGRRGVGDSTLARGPQQLVISQTDSSITLTPAGGEALTLRFDGQPVSLPGRGGYGTIQVAGHWHDRRFVVERRIGSTTITESYERSKDRAHLTVRIRTEDNFGEGREIKRVYDWVRRE